MKTPIQRALFALILLAGALYGVGALAQGVPPGVCTSDPTFDASTNTGIVSAIIDSIRDILYGTQGNGGVAQQLFHNITGANTGFNNGFFQALAAAVSLYIIIYGISFMLGIVQTTVVDFAMRVIKISVVALLVTPAAWNWFYGTVGVFFHEGADWLIATTLAFVATTGGGSGSPFALIDQAVAQALSAKMFVTLMATFTTGPYGLLIGLLMFVSLGTFVASLFQAIWVYLMALVVRAFLFGIAPIFIPMVLFSKTQHLFFNWLNQVVNTMLQPVFLFTFLSFFLMLMQAAMAKILGVPVCLVPGTGLFRGTPMDEQLWRFKVNDSPYGGAWGWNGPIDFPGVGFPINITDVLVFLILVQLAWRFNSVALNVAREISSAAMNLNMQGAFSSFLDPSQRFGFGKGGGLMGGKALTKPPSKPSGAAISGDKVANPPVSAVDKVKQQISKQVSPQTKGPQKPPGS